MDVKNETSLSTELVSILCILEHTVYALHPLKWIENVHKFTLTNV